MIFWFNTRCDRISRSQVVPAQNNDLMKIIAGERHTHTPKTEFDHSAMISGDLASKPRTFVIIYCLVTWLKFTYRLAFPLFACWSAKTSAYRNRCKTVRNTFLFLYTYIIISKLYRHSLHCSSLTIWVCSSLTF